MYPSTALPDLIHCASPQSQSGPAEPEGLVPQGAGSGDAGADQVRPLSLLAPAAVAERESEKIRGGGSGGGRRCGVGVMAGACRGGLMLLLLEVVGAGDGEG